jgi:hypothetical protein
MANTYVDYTATAGQTDFNFSFPYLENDHVEVLIDGVASTAFTIALSPTRVVLNTAATGGEVVRVRRSSDPTEDLVDFVNGSILTESDLDRAYLHNRYLNEEAYEGNTSSLQTAAGGTNFDANFNKIINLAPPTNSLDAANKNYVDDKLSLSGTSLSGFNKSTHTGDNATTTFTLSFTPQTGTAAAFRVAIDGVLQTPDDAYTVNTSTNQITFTSAPPTNAEIVVIATGTAQDVNSIGITATGSTTARSLANRFADVVNVRDFGASPSETASNNATYIKNAIEASENKTLIFENGTYLVDQLIVSSSNITIFGNHATIKYTEEVNSSSLRLTNARIMDLIIDGGNFNISGTTQGAYNSAPIRANGDYFVAENVTVKNLQGKENNYQYGIICDPYAKSIVRNCHFENIKTATNTANTGGFCGGFFLYSASGFSMRQSTHLVEGCTFKDIYSTQNAAGDQFWDSDGVRVFFNDINTGDAAYDAAVKQTVISITDCTFLNVLKSACKVQDATVFINNCRVTVDDLKDQGQTHNYVGFRYQQGHSISITNCSIVGLNRYGVIADGDNSYIQNVYVGMVDVVGVNQGGVVVGSVANSNNYTTIEGLVCTNTDTAIQISGADNVYVNNSKLVGIISTIELGELIVNNSSLTHMIDNSDYTSYAPYSSKYVFSNCSVDFSGNDGLYCNHIFSSTAFDFVLSGVKIKNARAEFINADNDHNIKIEDCNIDITSTYATVQDRFLEYSGNGTMRVIDTKISDLRTTTPQILLYTNNTAQLVEVDGLIFTANPSSSYSRAIYLAPSGDDCTLRNLVFNNLPSDATCIEISQSDYPSVSNVRANYANANMSFHGNVKAIVNMFHGTLKASPAHIVASGGTVVSEYNTTFF